MIMRLRSKLPSVFFFLFFMLMGCSHKQYPVTDHSDGDKFYNEDRSVGVNKGFFQLIKWQVSGDKKEWPEFVDDNVKPEFKTHLKNNEVAVTFINHATEFIQLENLNVITDPIFSKRASPLTWAGPKRHRKPGAEISELPKVDIVIVSHNHYDHLDLESIIAIEKKDHPLFIVPLGNKDLLKDNGIKNIIELDWWQKHSLPTGQTITLIPMQHWSARGVFDRFEALWGGYVISSADLKILFAGDTGYNNQFKEVFDKLGAMDLSILPIGAYQPRWFMTEQHMDPKEAVQAHEDLHSKFSIGTHFGTFQLTDEGIDEPGLDLATALEQKKISEKDFIAPQNGQTVLFSK